MTNTIDSIQDISNGDVIAELADEGVLLTTFNRPEQMNALNQTLGLGLGAALKFASEEDSVRAMVITGSGRAFCAGAEISGDRTPAESGEAPSDAAPTVSRHERLVHHNRSVQTALGFIKSDVPIIGAINGATAGAGFGMAMACDVRIAGKSARMGPIFFKRGIVSDYGVLWFLPRVVGSAKAFEVMYHSDVMPSEKLLEMGLVNRVVEDDDLLTEALAYARKVAAGPPLAASEIRRLLHSSLDATGSAEQWLIQEWNAQASLLKTNDAKEGFRSFVERRDPDFRGY